jgi:hypothetical protein
MILQESRGWVARLFPRRGVTSFGGPVAPLGYFRTKIVMSITLAPPRPTYCASSTSSRERM